MASSPLKILLIGAAGRLGAERAREFERRGHQLTESAPGSAMARARDLVPDVIVLDTGAIPNWRDRGPDLAVQPETRNVPVLVLHLSLDRPVAQLIALVERVGGHGRSATLH
jgi:NAD(P)-dependent dehydrogenase (short-subunit alcohol dehydrogenase family)